MDEDEKELLALALAAGVTSEELCHHPEVGLLISISGVHKLLATMPDTALKMKFLAFLQRTFPQKT